MDKMDGVDIELDFVKDAMKEKASKFSDCIF